MLNPTRNLLYIRPDDTSQDEVSPGGIVVPATVRPDSITGTVTATGPQCTEAQVGDRVLYAHNFGTKVEIEGEARLVMRETDLLGLERA